MAILDRRHTCRSASQRRLGNLPGVGEAGSLSSDRPQAEAQGGVEARRADPAVIETDLFTFPVFQEQLAIVASSKRLFHDPRRDRLAQCGV